MAVNYFLELYPTLAAVESGRPTFLFTGEVAKSLMSLVEIKLELKINHFYFKEVVEVRITRKSDGGILPKNPFDLPQPYGGDILGEFKSSDDLDFKMIATFSKQPYETMRLAQEQQTTTP